MAIPLYVTHRKVVHVEDCVRLNLPHRPGQIVPWDGSYAEACYTCLLPSHVRPHRLPCRICGHLRARPCKHNGVLRVVERRRRGRQAIWCWPDKVIEYNWLCSLLD